MALFDKNLLPGILKLLRVLEMCDESTVKYLGSDVIKSYKYFKHFH